jgi:glycerol-3-phosphate acyltransferase PlsY
MTSVLQAQNKIQSSTKMRLFALHNGVFGAVALWVIEVHVLGIDLDYRFGNGSASTLGVFQIVGVSLLFSLLGWVVLSLLEKRSASGASLWTVIATLVLVASFALPILAATTTAGMVALIVMHLAVGAGYIPFMYRSAVAAR